MTQKPLSAAHKNSAWAVIDPAYDAEHVTPARNGTSFWLYPRAVYESFLLVRMYEDVIRARLIAGYDMSRIPGCPAELFYRRTCETGTLSFRVSGSCTVYDLSAPGVILARGADGIITVNLSAPRTLAVHVTFPNPKFCLPALESELDGWEASRDGVTYTEAERGGSPFGEELPRITVSTREYAAGRFDAGREIFADVEIHSAAKPVFGFGESLYELENNDPRYAEQRLDLLCAGPGIWITPHPIAFRYIRAEAENDVRVVCRAVASPAQYRGAFSSADPELTRIWMNSAYTLRLCMIHFLVDGIKRDRLPWMGDHLVSMLTNGYSLADGEICRRTLTVLGNPGIRQSHINGILSFTLWLPIASHHYQLYWGDRAFLDRQYPELADIFDTLLERTADSVFISTENTWTFIDWTPEDKESANQVLFHYSLETSALLADRVGDSARAESLRGRAAQVRAKLFAECYDAEKKLFFAKPDDPQSGFNRYANMFAALSGLAGDDMKPAIRAALSGTELPPVGTPFMSALEALALLRCGAPEESLHIVRTVWGAMLREGATSFWEGYDARLKGKEQYAFYGRPYGKSLCHAWSSGPAMLLDLILFGIEPLSDGWKTFAVKPGPMLRDGDCVCVPTPSGEIMLERSEGKLKLQAPDSLQAVWK